MLAVARAQASVAWVWVVLDNDHTHLLTKKYKLPSDIVLKKKDNKYLFLCPSMPSWIVTNSNGAAALELCDGKRTLKDIIQISSKKIQRDTTDEIISFFQEIIANTNFFSSSTSCYYHPYKLRTVHLNMTDKCNLACIYCYADERSDFDDKLLLQDYLNLINSINKISKKAEIVFTGGEPLLGPYSLDIAEYAKSEGNDTHLLSNGLLITNANVKRIADLFDLIKISLDGSCPEIHDFHRGAGSFEKTMRAIELLIQNKANLRIAMTVTTKNINDIEAMSNRFGSLLSFAPLFKAGRAKNKTRLQISGTEYYNALSMVNSVTPLSYLCSSLERAKRERIYKCAIGDAEISIAHNGNVYPCHLLHMPKYLAGNVKKQSLDSIYETSGVLKSCRNLTVLEIKGCKNCEIRFVCGGACRARAFYETNKINVSGDFCEYEKLAFINGLFEMHTF